MDDAHTNLLEKVMDLCDSVISKAYVVTDGQRVSSIVLDAKIAEFLCKEMRKKYNSDVWIFTSIPEAIQYAFGCGRSCAFEELRSIQTKKAEQPVDDSVKGEVNGKDSELRSSDVQSEEKPD